MENSILSELDTVQEKSNAQFRRLSDKIDIVQGQVQALHNQADRVELFMDKVYVLEQRMDRVEAIVL